MPSPALHVQDAHTLFGRILSTGTLDAVARPPARFETLIDPFGFLGSTVRTTGQSGSRVPIRFQAVRV
jgi:hypothetical protein